MLPEDFDREAICRSISDGVYRAFADMINDTDLHSTGCDAILDSIESAFRGAIIEIMDACGGYPITRNNVMEMIKQGTAEAMSEKELP